MSAEGPDKTALRDFTVAKSEHLRPLQDRRRFGTVWIEPDPLDPTEPQFECSIAAVRR